MSAHCFGRLMLSLFGGTILAGNLTLPMTLWAQPGQVAQIGRQPPQPPAATKAGVYEALDYLPRRDLLVFGDPHRSFHVVRRENNEHLAQMVGHEDRRGALMARFGSRGRYLYTACLDGKMPVNMAAPGAPGILNALKPLQSERFVAKWNVGTGETVDRFPAKLGCKITALDVSPDRATLAFTMQNIEHSILRIIAIEQPKAQPIDVKLPTFGRPHRLNLAFAPDGKSVVVVQPHQINIVNIKSRRVLSMALDRGMAASTDWPSVLFLGTDMVVTSRDVETKFSTVGKLATMYRDAKQNRKAKELERAIAINPNIKVPYAVNVDRVLMVDLATQKVASHDVTTSLRDPELTEVEIDGIPANHRPGMWLARLGDSTLAVSSNRDIGLWSSHTLAGNTFIPRATGFGKIDVGIDSATGVSESQVLNLSTGAAKRITFPSTTRADAVALPEQVDGNLTPLAGNEQFVALADAETIYIFETESRKLKHRITRKGAFGQRAAPQGVLPLHEPRVAFGRVAIGHDRLLLAEPVYRSLDLTFDPGQLGIANPRLTPQRIWETGMWLNSPHWELSWIDLKTGKQVAIPGAVEAFALDLMLAEDGLGYVAIRRLADVELRVVRPAGKVTQVKLVDLSAPNATLDHQQMRVTGSMALALGDEEPIYRRKIRRAKMAFQNAIVVTLDPAGACQVLCETLDVQRTAQEGLPVLEPTAIWYDLASQQIVKKKRLTVPSRGRAVDLLRDTPFGTCVFSSDGVRHALVMPLDPPPSEVGEETLDALTAPSQWVRVYDLPSGRFLRTVVVPDKQRSTLMQQERAAGVVGIVDALTIVEAQISRDGKFLVWRFADSRGTVLVYNTRTNRAESRTMFGATRCMFVGTTGSMLIANRLVDCEAQCDVSGRFTPKGEK